MKLRTDGLTVLIDEITIVSEVTLQAESGQVVGLVGPNGSGKSTLLRAVYRALRPRVGFASLDDRDVWKMSARQAAQRMGVVVQEPPTEFSLDVWEVVLMGRIPHKGLLERQTTGDLQALRDALERVGMSGFAQRPYVTLSGGEKQRVLVARALAQQAQVLVLDEPTNHLDIRSQLEIMSLVQSLPVTALVAMHDLNLAAASCDQIFVLSGGKIVASGPIEEALQPEVIEQVFGVRAQMLNNPLTNRPSLVFAM